MTTFSRHTVRVGRSLFRPRPKCRPFRAERVAVIFVPAETAWWSAEEWEHDKDYQDWNKGPGITSAFWLNNYNAVFIGYRPIPDRKGWFDVCIYANDERGNFAWSRWIPLKEGDAAVLNVDLTDDETLRCTLKAGTEVVDEEFPWRKPWYNLYRWSGLSIGGADNADGPYGGQAHRYMDISAAFEKIA